MNLEAYEKLQPRGYVSLSDGNVAKKNIEEAKGGSSILMLTTTGDAVFMTWMSGDNTANIGVASGAQIELVAGRQYRVPIQDVEGFVLGQPIQITYDTNKTLRGIVTRIVGAGNGDRDGAGFIEIDTPWGGPSPNVANNDVIKSLEPNATGYVGFRLLANSQNVVKIPAWAKYIAFIRAASTAAVVTLDEVI